MKGSKKNIRCLKDESGEWCWDQDGLLSLAFKFFSSLYLDDSNSNAIELSIFSFLVLPSKACQVLAKPFDEEKVKNVVFDMDPFKAPGPDGFQACFYQKSWTHVGPLLVRMVLDVLHHGILDNDLREILIALIPKVDVPEPFPQLWPISLCIASYKAITKVLLMGCECCYRIWSQQARVVLF